MLGLLGLLTGLAGPIAAVVGKLADARTAKAQAASNEDIKRLDAEIAEGEGRKAVLIAEAGNRIAGALNAIIRAAIAVGPISYILKYYLWDKVIGSFVGCANLKGPKHGCETFITDGLNGSMVAVLTAVLAFYLAYDMAARFRK